MIFRSLDHSSVEFSILLLAFTRKYIRTTTLRRRFRKGGAIAIALHLSQSSIPVTHTRQDCVPINPVLLRAARSAIRHINAKLRASYFDMQLIKLLKLGIIFYASLPVQLFGMLSASREPKSAEGGCVCLWERASGRAGGRSTLTALLAPSSCSQWHRAPLLQPR